MLFSPPAVISLSLSLSLSRLLKSKSRSHSFTRFSQSVDVGSHRVICSPEGKGSAFSFLALSGETSQEVEWRWRQLKAVPAFRARFLPHLLLRIFRVCSHDGIIEVSGQWQDFQGIS